MCTGAHGGCLVASTAVSDEKSHKIDAGFKASIIAFCNLDGGHWDIYSYEQ